ncbi:hypothetical protein GCM10027340_04060 [Marinomonas epiphytica]
MGLFQSVSLDKITHQKTTSLKFKKSSNVSLLEPFRRNKKYIAQIILSAYLSAPGVLLAEGAKAALNSAHAPGFDVSASGVPIVNINAPSAKGVSRNEYDQLNVNNIGLIFNNSTNITATQLAGYIDGNQRLEGKSASIILNEVTGNSRSALNGYMEIAGRSAEMVIANQNGITCDGCGFINTTRATLTTGQALFDGQGGLSGFDVSRGDIAISGQGLNDTQTHELDILARSVKLNAKLWTDQATIITGDNLINYQDKSVTARSSGEREEFALDVAAIGGMYANRIRLIGTEQGLGVNIGGEVRAVDDIVLDSQGNIVHGATLSADDIQIEANVLKNSGAILGNKVSLAATQTLVNSNQNAQVHAAKTLNLSSYGDIVNDNDAIFSSDDQLVIHTNGTFSNLNGANTYSSNDMTLQSLGGLVNQTSTIEAAHDLTLISQAFSNDANSTMLAENGILNIMIGEREDDDILTLTGPLTNKGTLTGKDVKLTATAIYNDTSNSRISATGDATLIATKGEVSNTNSASIRTNGLLTIEARTDLINTVSQIESAQNIRLSSRNIDNTAGALIRANDTITLDWEGALTNDNAIIEARNTIQTAQAIQSTEDNVENPRSGSLTNQSNGTITALNGQLDLTLGSLANYGVIGANRVTLNSSSLLNSGSNGAIVANEYLDLASNSSIDNYDGASLFSLGSGELYAKGNITNSSADIETRGGDLTIEASNIVNKRSLVKVEHNSVSRNHEITGSIIVIQEPVHERKGKITEQTFTTYTETIVTPYISQISVEGKITSQGSLNVEGYVDNLYSTISANNNLNFNGGINNQSLTATQTIKTNGTDRNLKIWHSFYRESRKGKGSYNRERRSETTTNFNRLNTKPVSLLSPTLSSKNAITGKGGSIQNVGSVDEISEELSRAEMIKQRRNAIFDDLSIDDFISSAQFSVTQSLGSGYLIETNPLFTNYKTFISSDYLLNKMLGDSNGRTGKTASRLGDGYLEQQMVRQQILSYTGQQTLPNQEDIESAYATLMDNALNIYTDLKLSTGIALSNEQVAKLKQPIVWMVTETVQTASGPKQALVPKVYLPNTDDLMLRPDGALIAANNIDIEVDESLTNSGAILASNGLNVKAKNIENTGSLTATDSLTLDASEDLTSIGGDLSGQDIHLSAGQDIKMVASSVEAQGSLALAAGNDIQLSATQSMQTTGFTDDITTTTTHNMTQLTGKTVALNAESGKVTSEAAHIKATQSIDISAEEVELLALADSTKRTIDNSSKWNPRTKDITTSSSVTHQLSQLEAGNINIQAAETITSQGAQLAAEEDLTLSANNIDLLAVKDTKDAYSFVGGGGNATEKSSHNESLTGTKLSAGGTLNLVSQQDIFSEGSTLTGDNDIALAAGGDVMLASAQATNSSFEEVKKKRSGLLGSKTSTKTSTSESTTNQGTNLASGGDIQITSGADIILSGSKATAAGGIDLQAQGDIQLLSAVDQSSSRYQEQKKGTFKVKAKDQGSITQTAVTSDLVANGTSGDGDIALASGNNITLEGATLAANDTLSMGAGSDSLQAVTQNADGNYVSANGAQVGNVIVGSKALQSSEWSESSSGFRGIFKDLAKGLAVVAAIGTGGLVHGDIKVGEADATRTDSLTQQTATLAANELDINAQNNLTLIGTNVEVSNTANLSANDIIIDAAREQTVVSNAHTDQTVSGKGAALQKDQISLASITETDQTERTTTTSNTWAGSSISAGNLNIQANNNVAIVASDVNVTNDVSIEGDNVLIGGREATTETTHDSITKTKTLDAGVRNAYVDVVLAAEALKDAKDAVGDAKDAYDDAKQKVAEGKLPESDLDFYKVNLAAATANLASATTAVTSAGASAAASTATYGFTVSGGVTTQTDTTSTTTTQGTWNGSNINIGNNASVASENNLNIEGSSINTVGQLALNAQNINITAGQNTYTENTESHSEGASASYGSSGGFSGGINANQSKSDSQSVTHSNSQIGAGSLVSNSDKLTIKGGNLNATDIDITTNNLTVASLQDTANSNSKSTGGSVGFGSSNNVGINASQSSADSAWVNQQSGITGSTVNIAAKDTSLTGGVIAAVDEEGNSTDRLNLTTDTLTVADLQDFDNSQSKGIDLSLSKNTTTLGANFNGHEKAQTNNVTIGLGSVTVSGTDLNEQAQFADLNRDAANSQEITKDMERGGLDMSLTVDNRMLSEAGWEDIAEDVEKTNELAGDGANALGMKGVTKFLYNINDPEVAAQLQGREEAALDALIDVGVDPKIAKSIMTNPNLFQTAGGILTNEQALLDGREPESPEIEKGASTNESAKNSEGMLVVEITSGRQNNPVEKVLLGAKEVRDFVSTLPAEEANAAMLALGVLTGGVIKTAIEVGKDVIINETMGDTLNDLQKSVATAAAAGAQGIDLATQKDYIEIEGERGGHAHNLQEGAEFGLEVIGLGAGAGLIKTGIGQKSVVNSSVADSSGSVGSGLGPEDNLPVKSAPTRESVRAELDKLPDGQGANFDVRQNADGSFSAVRKDVDATPPIKVTEDGNLASPIKTQSNSDAQVVQNRIDGSRREAEVEAELKEANPNASVQNEQFLRDKNGNIVVDRITGERRRVDHVVIEDGRVTDAVETTSLTAKKDAQKAKEDRILEQGGNFVKDRDTGCTIPLDCEIRLDRRE